VNGAWHSIYPFYAEKQHVSRKGKITAHHLIRLPSHLLTSSAFRLPLNSGRISQIMVHRKGQISQGPHSSLTVGPMLRRMLIGWLAGGQAVWKENLQRRNPLPSSHAMTSFVGRGSLCRSGPSVARVEISRKRGCEHCRVPRSGLTRQITSLG
jgi:hypothetical protein